jgi:antitoxin component of RelBE/YafQ-DinJ toxin-antitoxin module
MRNTEALPVRVDPETKRMAAEKAESLGISVSAYVRMLIRLDNREAGEPKRPRE